MNADCRDHVSEGDGGIGDKDQSEREDDITMEDSLQAHHPVYDSTIDEREDDTGGDFSKGTRDEVRADTCGTGKVLPHEDPHLLGEYLEHTEHAHQSLVHDKDEEETQQVLS